MIALADFAPVATGEDWADTIELIDADSGGPVDLTGFSFVLEARRMRPNGVGEIEVSGALPAELTLPDGPAGGLVALTFRRPFAGKPSGRYRVTLTATNGSDTLVILSHLNVLNLAEAP